MGVERSVPDVRTPLRGVFNHRTARERDAVRAHPYLTDWPPREGARLAQAPLVSWRDTSVATCDDTPRRRDPPDRTGTGSVPIVRRDASGSGDEGGTVPPVPHRTQDARPGSEALRRLVGGLLRRARVGWLHRVPDASEHVVFSCAHRRRQLSFKVRRQSGRLGFFPGIELST